jgi:hypothetical protein
LVASSGALEGIAVVLEGTAVALEAKHQHATLDVAKSVSWEAIDAAVESCLLILMETSLIFFLKIVSRISHTPSETYVVSVESLVALVATCAVSQVTLACLKLVSVPLAEISFDHVVKMNVWVATFDVYCQTKILVLPVATLVVSENFLDATKNHVIDTIDLEKDVF